MSEEARREPAVLFPVVPATIFQYNVDVPSQGQGIFQASNPPFGAALDYWLGQEVEGGIRIRIENAGGATLRVLEGPGTAGFHRLVWDLRHQPVPHDTTVFEPPSLDVGPQGPLVMPGTYRARLTGPPEGGDEIAVEVRWDPMMPLSESEIRSRYDFTLELYELQQLGYHAQVQARLTEDAARAAVDSLRVLAGVSADTPDEERPAQVEQADSLLEEIRSAASGVRARNRDLRGWWRGLIGEFDGGPSTLGSLTGPNDSQVQRLAWTRQAFEDAVTALDEVISEVVPALNDILAGEGVDAVEVPERGSGTG